MFVTREVSPASLMLVEGGSWKGTVKGDHRSFATVVTSRRDPRMAYNYGRGGGDGRGNNFPHRNFPPRRPVGGFAAGAFDNPPVNLVLRGDGRDLEEEQRRGR